MSWEKKDIHFAYITGILIFVIIGLVTFQVAERPDIVTLISIASGAVSLVLGLVAIVYAFISNASLGGTSSKLEDSAKQIASSTELVVKKLDLLREEIS